MQYRLDQLSVIKRGGSPRPIADYLVEDGLPWLKISDFSFGQRYVYDSREYIRPEGLSKTKLVKKDTLIVTNSASPGIPIFLGRDTCLHDGFLYFESISNKVNPLYLFYFLLCHRDDLKSQGNGSIFVNLKKDILEKTIIDLPSIEKQNHIVNTIGSVDDLIENKQIQINKICMLLEESLQLYEEKIAISEYAPKIIKSGINRFDKAKNYLDTSCVEGINNISSSELIEYNKRPSRANMQPIASSVWFAKMKGSNKILIITDKDEDILSNDVLSTGFLGVKASSRLPLSLLASIVISNDFKTQRNLNSIGTTMAGVNNETFLKIQVPYLDENEALAYEEKYSYLIYQLSSLRREIDKLKLVKDTLLKKYF